MRKKQPKPEIPSNDINAILDKIDALISVSDQKETIESQGLSQSGPQGGDVFCEAQREEIKKGEADGLPVELYAKSCYNWMQMYELRLGLAANLDTSRYDSPLYSANQMRQIRLGLADHLDVFSYATLMLSATDMLVVRRALFAQAYKESPKGFARTLKCDEPGLVFRISDDYMKVFAKKTPEARPDLSEEDILNALDACDITYGILEDQVRKLAAEKAPGHEICVAQGKPPIKGKSGWFELFFENSIEKSHTVAPDDEIDYGDVKTIDAIVPGDVLAKYHFAERNVSGMTVSGMAVDGVVGEDLPVLTGIGMEYDPEQNLYIATASGYASFNGVTGTLNVWKIYEVHGDVSYLKSLSYDGTVHIFGSVHSLAVIHAKGDIIIDGFVENACIYSEHDIVIKGGVNNGEQGEISAGGAVRGKFFENSTIRAGGLIESNYFLNCNITTDDRLIAKGRKARIIGGRIEAAVGVEAVIIGNYLSTKTLFVVGDAASIESRITAFTRKRNKTREDLQKLQEGKQKLLLLLGEEQAKGNALYEKTAAAIAAKEEEEADLENKISQLNIVLKRSEKAYVHVHGELQPDVTFIIRGIRKRTEKLIRHGILLTREKLAGTKPVRS